MQLCPCVQSKLVNSAACPQSRKPLRKFAASNLACRSAVRIRASARPETQRDPRVPSAPPVRVTAPPPPPPPPTPPPPPPPQGQDGISRRTILAVMLGGSLASYGARKSLEPKIYHDKYGVRYLKTEKGNQVAVGMDRESGNIMMVDHAGNLYYDTGDQRLGVYMVRMDGDLYNIYTDESGQQQSKLMGNVSDLRTVKVKQVGGIPIEKLQAHYDIQRDRAGKKDRGMPDFILGFPDDRQVPVPQDAVMVQKTGKNKLRFEGPPVIDEGAIELEDKHSWWPFMEPGGGKFQRGSGL